MPTFEELERMTTKELHDRAFSVAKRRLDMRFFWNLLEAVPAAEAASGHLNEAGMDILSFAQRVDDLVHPDTTEEANAFRPIYIDYLLQHPQAESREST